MTTYYLSSVDGSNASDGLSWDNAYATIKYAVETVSAAASGPHLLYVDSAHSESLAADTTVTVAGHIRVLCVNRSTGALATSAVIGAQATNYSFTITNAANNYWKSYFYGLSFRIGTGNSSKNISCAAGDGTHVEYENCSFGNWGTGSASSITLCGTGSAHNAFARFTNCSFRFGAVGNFLGCGECVELINCSIDSGGSTPTSLFLSGAAGDKLVAEGCDFSKVGTNLVAANETVGQQIFNFINCKIAAAVVPLAAITTVINKGANTVRLFNCASGDTHYVMAHYDAFGETTVSTSVYANDGAAYDGTNRCSWKIVTTANCSYYTPYVSPWLDKYHDGTSEISPYLEMLRSGSTTNYQNDEVWGEWSYQGTSGSTKATVVSDRMTPLGTAADQTASALDADDWTGEDAANNAFQKLEAGAITPAEIGHIRARVCVGEPSITVYVDPQIRDDGTAGSGQSRVTPSGWIDTVASNSSAPRFGDRTGGLR